MAVFRTRHWAPDFHNEDVGASREDYARSKTQRCQGCSAFDRCEGLWNEYLRRYGDEELSPINRETTTSNRPTNDNTPLTVALRP